VFCTRKQFNWMILGLNKN